MGRRTIYQLRNDSNNILSAASAEYLDFVTRNTPTELRGDAYLRRLCNYYEQKQILDFEIKGV